MAANDVEQTDMFAYEYNLCLPLLSSLISWRAFSLATSLSMTSLCHPQGNATLVSKTLPSAGGGGGIIHILYVKVAILQYYIYNSALCVLKLGIVME